jgi:hypothetical protein
VGVGGRVSRRALLGGAAAVAAAGAAGCASSGPSSTAGAATSGAASPTVVATAATGSDHDIVVAALKGEQATLAAYTALARTHPPARTRIAPLIGVQRQHVDALTTALQLDSPPPAPTVDEPVRPLGIAVLDLARRAARDRLADCRAVASGSVASMLASMAASHSVVASEWTAA